MTFSKTLGLKLTAAIAVCAAGFMAAPKPAAAEPFIGEVRAFGEGFCPRGWSAADGKLLPIAQYTALFSIIGTIYGGDGRTTTALPNLIGRAPQSDGTGPGLSTVRLGERAGTPTRVLSEANLPSHNHIVNATNAGGDKLGPKDGLLADPNTGITADARIYHDGSVTPNRVMDPGMIASAGGSQPINIQSPYLAMYWCVALEGLYPSRS